MASIPYVSPSQLSKMMKCMRWWYYDYVLHLPSPYKSRFAVGKAFHKSVEKNLQSKIDDGELLSKDDALAVASDDFDKESLVVEEWLHERGKEKDCCMQVSASHYDVLAPKIEPLAVEKKWESTIAGVKAIGIMDILEKTRVRDTKFKGSSPAATSPIDFVQTTIYSKVAREVLEINVEEFIFDCFTPLKQSVKYTPIVKYSDKVQEDRLEGEMHVRISMAEQGLFPRTNPDMGICSYCPHAEFCWKTDKS